MNEETPENLNVPQKANPLNRPPMIRGGIRPGMLQQSGGNPLSEEEMRIWDKKEDERRALIKERYDDVIKELQDSKDRILEIVNEAKVVFKGRDHRIDITQGEVSEIFDLMGQLNAALGKTRSLTDAYIHFARSTPDLTAINTILYYFNKFLLDSQQRPFFILWVEEGKYYFRAVKIKDYANKISFLTERIIGSLYVASNYILDIPKVHPQQQKYDGFGSPQITGGINRFDNRFPGSRFSQPGMTGANNAYLKKVYEQSLGNKNRNVQTDPVLEELRRLKTIEKTPSHRDFGDEFEEYDGA